MVPSRDAEPRERVVKVHGEAKCPALEGHAEGNEVRGGDAGERSLIEAQSEVGRKRQVV